MFCLNDESRWSISGSGQPFIAGNCEGTSCLYLHSKSKAELLTACRPYSVRLTPVSIVLLDLKLISSTVNPFSQPRARGAPADWRQLV